MTRETKTVVLEPFMTEQWYLNVTPLAEKAIGAVEDGRTKIVPDQWQDVYFRWMRNIHPLVYLPSALVGSSNSRFRYGPEVEFQKIGFVTGA